METILYIYLAGTIKKSQDEKELEWTEADMLELKRLLAPLQVAFLNPATRSDDLGDQKSVFGRDLFQVYSSHLILVDAREKRGLGVGAEMMFAKMNRIPVVAWLPQESHYHRQKIHLLGQHVKDWIHPFVYNLSDYLAPSLEKAADWIQNILLKGNAKIKGPEVAQQAIQHYLDTQLHFDHGMKEIVEAQDYFTQKINRISNNFACLEKK